MKKFLTTAAFSILAFAGAYAQDEPKLEVKPSGRVLLDAGVMHSNDDAVDSKLNDGVAIPDVRVGVSAKYGKWRAKADIGFARQKLSFKDVNLQYDFNKQNFIRGGYFVHQFGLQSATSSSYKVSMEEPTSNQVFNNARLLGVMFLHTDDHFHATASLFAENDAMKNSTDKLGNEGWGMLTRLLYRPFIERGHLMHFGISAGFETPRYNSDATLNHDSYVLKAPFPTRIADVAAQQATIDHAKNLWKISPEFTAAFGNFGIEAQYYYMNINRDKGYHDFQAWGAYGTARYLIKGQGYTYTKNDAGIDTPDPGSMELVAAYSYSTLNDDKAGIQGGKVSDWSLTYNYYLNKYMIWRVRGSITRATKSSFMNDNTTSILETRLQFKF